MCNSIKSHLAEVMQFQVRDQALCLLPPLITNTLVFCCMQLLWGKKQNKIQFTCICHESIASATQRQEIEKKDASYWILRKCDSSLSLEYTVGWFEEGSVFCIQPMSLAPRHLLFRHVCTLAPPLFILALKIFSLFYWWTIDTDVHPEQCEESPSSWKHPWSLTGKNRKCLLSHRSLFNAMSGCLLPCLLW